MIPQSWSLFLGTFLGRVSFVSLHFSFILGCESVFTPRCPGAQAVAGTEPRCGRALFPALLPVRLFSPSFLEPRKWAQGCVQSQGTGQWQSPAFQPCSLALELSFLNAVASCFLGGVAGRTRGACGHRVLLVTVFCFLFFCWGRVVSGSVPWGLALRRTSVGCLQGHPLEIWGVKEAGLDQKWGGLS